MKSLKLKLNSGKILAFVFAFRPFLWFYDIGINFYIFLILLGAIPYIILRMARNGKGIQLRENPLLRTFIWIFLYVLVMEVIRYVFVYDVIETEMVQVAYYFIPLVVSAVVFHEKLLREYFFRYLEIITLFMSICIVVQYILFYVGRMGVQESLCTYMPFQNFMTENVIAYESRWNLQFAYASSFFRPCAFFLEPAHYSAYCALGLVSILTRKDIKKAVFVSAALVMTLSGLGIALVFLLWAGYAIVSFKWHVKRSAVWKTALFVLLVILVIVFMYQHFPIFQNALVRMFSEYNGYSAWQGRTWSWVYVRNLSGIGAWIGMGFGNVPVYMTAAAEVFYCQGMLGGIIICSFFAKMAWHLWGRRGEFSLLVILVWIMTFLGSASLINVILFVPFLCDKYEKSAKEVGILPLQGESVG